MKENDIEVIHKEIDLIQNCISRMAQNSFLIKGWALTVLTVVLALMEKNIDPIYLCLVLFIPLMAFWYLDAFFLQTEKMFRKLYEWVIEVRPKNNFSLLYDLNPHRFKDKVDSLPKVMWSITLRIFYGIPLFVVIVIIVYQIFLKYFYK
jgi:hypothetical protein